MSGTRSKQKSGNRNHNGNREYELALRYCEHEKYLICFTADGETYYLCYRCQEDIPRPKDTKRQHLNKAIPLLRINIATSGVEKPWLQL